jgi:hypothetical protein
MIGSLFCRDICPAVCVVYVGQTLAVVSFFTNRINFD